MEGISRASDYRPCQCRRAPHYKFSDAGAMRLRLDICFATVQLVLLYSWQFECTGVGTFRDYMQRINVSMAARWKIPAIPMSPIPGTSR